MKNIFWFILFSFFILSKVEGIAQKTDSSIHYRNNVVYGELFGNVGLSINYERKFLESKEGFFTARIGSLGGRSSFDHKEFDLYSCVLVNYVFGKGKNHFEMGGGARLVASNYVDGMYYNKLKWDKYNCVPTLNFSYRYQKPRGRFIFRVGWTPWIYLPFLDVGGGTAEYLFLCGISVGYAF